MKNANVLGEGLCLMFLEFKFCQKFKVQKIDVMQNGNSFSLEKLLIVAK
jgi:hypothetical protein